MDRRRFLRNAIWAVVPAAALPLIDVPAVGQPSWPTRNLIMHGRCRRDRSEPDRTGKCFLSRGSSFNLVCAIPCSALSSSRHSSSSDLTNGFVKMRRRASCLHGGWLFAHASISSEGCAADMRAQYRKTSHQHQGLQSGQNTIVYAGQKVSSLRNERVLLLE
jgi:hypothetical protein